MHGAASVYGGGMFDPTWRERVELQMAVGIATDIWEPEDLQRHGLDLAFGLPNVARWLADAATGETDALRCVGFLYPTLRPGYRTAQPMPVASAS